MLGNVKAIPFSSIAYNRFETGFIYFVWLFFAIVTAYIFFYLLNNNSILRSFIETMDLMVYYTDRRKDPWDCVGVFAAIWGLFTNITVDFLFSLKL